MQLVEVKDDKTRAAFLEIARTLYKNDPWFVCPLDADIEGGFDAKQNVFFENGEATRWILQDDKGKTIGRVAAFINKKKAFTFDQPTGGMGFFECINDKKAAFMLMDKCQEWLKERGMEAMDGPINFGENDRFWGLLVEGFTHPGYGMTYNHAYYKPLFEDYGFKFYFEQVSNHLDLTKPFEERFLKIGNWIRNKEGYEFKPFKKSEANKFVADFVEVYNDAWAFHEDFTPINPEDLRRTIKKMEPIMEEDFIQFAYHEGEPIGFMIMIPDVNQVIKHMHGKLNFWTKLKFAWLKWRKTITRARIIIMGVKPKYQRYGIESGLILGGYEAIVPKGHYTEVELSWVGDFNPKMRALHEGAGAVLGKKHYTYRKLFKENDEAKRSVIIPVDTKEKALKGEQA